MSDINASRPEETGRTSQASGRLSVYRHDTTNDGDMSTVARLSRLGIETFPCNQNKTPAIKRGIYDARLTWPSGFNPPLIGIPTGKVNGFWVLDVDCHGEVNGFVTLYRLAAGRQLPLTAQQETLNKGRHVLFTLPDFEIRCSAGRLGAGLDVRGDGGYICTGAGYTWLNAPELGIAAAPNWLLDLLRPIPEPAKPMPQVIRQPVSRSNPARWLDIYLRRATIGSRNRSCFLMARQMQAEGMPMSEALRLAELFAGRVQQSTQDTFTVAEAINCVKSAYRYPSLEVAR